MTCQHYCRVQCHSALPATKERYHLVAQNRTEERRLHIVIPALFSYLLISPLFEVSNDRLTSQRSNHHTCQAFRSLRCSECAEHKASVYAAFVSTSKTLQTANGFKPMTRGAKCFLNIRWLLPRSILHSRAKTSQTPSQVFPPGAHSSSFAVEGHPPPPRPLPPPGPRTRHVKLNDFEESQS